MAIGGLFFAFLVLNSFMPVLCQVEADAEADISEILEGGDTGIIGSDIHGFGDGFHTHASGVDTTYIFPENPGKFVRAGEETELLVGIHNEGEIALKIIAVKGSIYLPFDHHMLVQNLTVQEFYNATVPAAAQATFLYTFSVSKYLQPGSFDLVGAILYEMDGHPYRSVFYNGTIEVVEAGGFLAGESIFLVALGVTLIVFLGLWIYSQLQTFSKRTKKVPKVEVGTGTKDSSLDEWLEGTAYAQAQKSNKKKK